MNLSINQSNTIPSIGPTLVTADDIAQMVPKGYFATRQLASVTTNEMTVEVTTMEGDQVTLTQSSSLVNYTYLRPEGMDVPELIDAQVLSENVSIEIKGELSQEEQYDIAAAQKGLVHSMADNSEANNTSQRLFSDYETLSSLSFNAQVEKIKASASDMTIVPDPGNTDRNLKQTDSLLVNSLQTITTATYLSLIV